MGCEIQCWLLQNYLQYKIYVVCGVCSWFGGDSVGETREATVFEGYRVKGGLSWSCGGLDESASLIAMGSSGGLGSACGGNMLEEKGIWFCYYFDMSTLKNRLHKIFFFSYLQSEGFDI